ncbi:MAG: hypothetical protein IJM27_05205 [Eubacterium sp.]|nr:hypothetical protein [Eubacterium sp.]
MGREESFKQKEQRLKEYEHISNRNLQKDETQLGYRDMNARFLNAEKEALGKQEGVNLNKVMEAHEQKKKQIEAAWHANTTNAVKSLKKQAPKKGSEKNADYYAAYSLKDLEVFLKNSDRGGNSDEFNAVATDLELYNRVMDSADPIEGMGLLKLLKESCDEYLRTRKSPASTKGKVRKAIITQVSRKVETELERQRDEYQNMQKNTLKAMREENSSENVTAAFKANYNLVYQSMTGNIDLTPEEMQTLDSNMEEVLKELKKQEVDKNQSKSLSSKFFNALGWAKNDARIVKTNDFFGKEMKSSPHKKLCYHSIGPLDLYDKEGNVTGKAEDALPQAKQLAGFSKEGKGIYYGIGRIGKGCYTAARNNDPDAKDEEAKHNSWSYGTDKGSVMFTMLLNENARITTEWEMNKVIDDISKKYPKIYSFIRSNEVGRFRDYLTMLASLVGYNTIIGDGVKHVDYITTSDRKALTMLDDIEVRTEDDDEVFTNVLSLTQLKEEEEKGIQKKDE